MKTLASLFVFVGFTGLSVVALANTPSTPPTQVTQPSQDTQVDSQIIKTIMVIDDNELDAARLALQKTSNPDVKKFAQLMITDHTNNMKAVKNLSTKIKTYPMSSDQSISLEKNGLDDLNKLKALQGKAFDSAYINAMVDGHQAVIQLLVSSLIPKAANPQLVTFLKSTQTTVEHHLDMAKQTQKQLS